MARQDTDSYSAIEWIDKTRGFIKKRECIHNIFLLCSFQKGCIIMSWILAILIMVPQFFSEHSFALEGFLTTCSFDYLTRDLYTRVYVIVMFITGFFAPLIVIAGLYFLIWYILKTNKMRMNYRKIKRPQLSVHFSSEQPSQTVSMVSKPNSSHTNQKSRMILLRDEMSYGSPLTGLNNGDKRRVESESNQNTLVYVNRESRIVKTILIIVGMYCVAWTPYAVVTFYAQFGNDITYFVTPYTTSIPALFAKASR